MKTPKKLFILAIFLGFVFLNTRCSKSGAPANVTWEGHVHDSTGKPVSGIIVTLEGGQSVGGSEHYEETEIGKCTTDAAGHFKIYGKASSQDAYFPDILCPTCSSFVFFAEDPTQTHPVSSKDLATTKFTDLHVP